MKKKLLVIVTAGLVIAIVVGLLKPKNEFEAILRDWDQAGNAYFKADGQAKTADERRKVRAEKLPKSEPFAERCLKLAETQPDTSVGLSALCWAAVNALSTEPGQNALAIEETSQARHRAADASPPATG